MMAGGGGRILREREEGDDESINTVMSDSDESGVTHTEISVRLRTYSDVGFTGVLGPEHEGLPWMLDDPYVQVALQASPSPDYIPGPEEPQSPPLPAFITEPVYLEYMPQEDEVFLAEEQPLHAAALPTAQSPNYVPESDPEADPEEDDDEDPEEDHVDYPADGGDENDDEDEGGAPPAPSARSSAISGTMSPRQRLPDSLEDRPKVTLPPRKRLGIALGPTYEVGESSSAAAARPAGGLRADYGFVATIDREIRRDPERDVGYGITESWDEIVETLQGAPVSTDTELGRHEIVEAMQGTPVVIDVTELS
ncbi:hypothetical protein Tco_0990088 [Tanacetum coccineum]|uniref:Uncharacterized protein n=1 Tax=Tanacetum coccineum TaxID=301880 RepID=A0ABQ5EVX5_9ASTR